MGNVGKRSRSLPKKWREATPARQCHVGWQALKSAFGGTAAPVPFDRSGRDDPDSVAEPFEGRGNSFQDERMIVDDE